MPFSELAQVLEVLKSAWNWSHFFQGLENLENALFWEKVLEKSLNFIQEVASYILSWTENSLLQFTCTKQNSLNK